MKFIENKEKMKEHLITKYSTIVVDYEESGVYFYKIDYEKKDFVIEISPYNDFRLFDFKYNWRTWEEFIDKVVLNEEPLNYTIIEEFTNNNEFEINIERVK